jgi:hypothetical protein
MVLMSVPSEEMDTLSTFDASLFLSNHSEFAAYTGQKVLLMCDIEGAVGELLATWAWRSGPTPWLVMVAKANG